MLNHPFSLYNSLLNPSSIPLVGYIYLDDTTLERPPYLI